MWGGEGVWMWGKREIIYLLLHCHHQNDSCIKMGSDESHFNISVGTDGESHKTVHKPQPFWRERRAKAVSNLGPSAYQPNALPLGQSGPETSQNLWFYISLREGIFWLARTDTVKGHHSPVAFRAVFQARPGVVCTETWKGLGSKWGIYPYQNNVLHLRLLFWYHLPFGEPVSFWSNGFFNLPFTFARSSRMAESETARWQEKR